MPPVGFETTIPVSERPKTHALDRTATGIGPCLYSTMFNSAHENFTYLYPHTASMVVTNIRKVQVAFNYTSLFGLLAFYCLEDSLYLRFISDVR
jgi:hypothetical protein